jgi:hypothetical protein
MKFEELLKLCQEFRDANYGNCVGTVVLHGSQTESDAVEEKILEQLRKMTVGDLAGLIKEANARKEESEDALAFLNKATK